RPTAPVLAIDWPSAEEERDEPQDAGAERRAVHALGAAREHAVAVAAVPVVALGDHLVVREARPPAEVALRVAHVEVEGRAVRLRVPGGERREPERARDPEPERGDAAGHAADAGTGAGVAAERLQEVPHAAEAVGAAVVDGRPGTIRRADARVG